MTDPTAAERIVNVMHGRLLFHTPDGYDTICTCIGEPYVTQIVNAITTALAEARREGKCEGFEDATRVLRDAETYWTNNQDVENEQRYGASHRRMELSGLVKEFRRRSRAH